MSDQSAMSPTTISTVPEELRQEIISCLNYDDAWSLKRTSTLFYSVVEIPTIKSFLACPNGRSLGMLEDGLVIPRGCERRYYCNRILQKERFSRFQRHLTAARQDSLCFDYVTWKPEKHFCLLCGVKHHHYPGGKRIYIGYGDPGYKDEAIMPCEDCGTLVNYEPWDFRFCPDCNGFIGSDETESRWTRTPSSSNLHPDMVVASDESQSEEVAEPQSKDYEDAEPGSLLALIGERLLSNSPKNAESVAEGKVREGERQSVYQEQDVH